MTASNFDLSIIIPSYNEEARLPETLQRIAEYLPTLGLRTEVLVVDDGSIGSNCSGGGIISREAYRASRAFERHKSRKRLQRAPRNAGGTGRHGALHATLIFPRLSRSPTNF